jgi:hypothetical protein
VQRRIEPFIYKARGGFRYRIHRSGKWITGVFPTLAGARDGLKAAQEANPISMGNRGGARACVRKRYEVVSRCPVCTEVKAIRWENGMTDTWRCSCEERAAWRDGVWTGHVS